MKKLIGFVVLLLMVSMVVAQDDVESTPEAPEDAPMVNPYIATDGTMVIAHQGGDGVRPSNTMKAFDLAVAMGVDMLEMDIHSTADGVLVVIHDDTVDRTTDGTGAVNDLTLEEILALDAGYNWPTLGEEENPPEVEGNPYRGQGAQIAVLEDLFEAYPDMPMTIEIKQAEPSIAEPFCEMLRDYEMTDKVIVASFNEEAMFEFRETCPEVMTSAVESEARDFLAAALLDTADETEWAFEVLQVPEKYGAVTVVNQNLVECAHDVGIAVQVWTVNYPEDMNRLVELGVDGIITDYPNYLMGMLGRLSEERQIELDC